MYDTYFCHGTIHSTYRDLLKVLIRNNILEEFMDIGTLEVHEKYLGVTVQYYQGRDLRTLQASPSPLRRKYMQYVFQEYSIEYEYLM